MYDIDKFARKKKFKEINIFVQDPEFEQQKKEIKTEFKNELRQMELVRKQCIKDYQKVFYIKY